MGNMQVFYGATVTSRSEGQLLDIIRRAEAVSDILRRHGYQCLTDVVTRRSMYVESDEIKVKNIPEQYTALASQQLESSLEPFRLKNKWSLADNSLPLLGGGYSQAGSVLYLGSDASLYLRRFRNCYSFGYGKAVFLFL